jgi:type II secretory pathway pseudopilin PulG
MSSKCRRYAFTVIEVLIVVIIVAVLGATIIPQFVTSSQDTKTSNLNFKLQSVRAQLEMYKDRHLGAYPPATDSASFAAQMCDKTNPDTPLNAAKGPCGPCLEGDLPVNPFNNSSTVAIISGTTAPTAPTGSSDGWQYNPTTGWFYPNNAEFFQPAQ